MLLTCLTCHFGYSKLAGTYVQQGTRVGWWQPRLELAFELRLPFGPKFCSLWKALQLHMLVKLLYRTLLMGALVACFDHWPGFGRNGTSGFG
jgi:hypothetical protein